MAKLSEEMKESISESELFPLATSSKSGIPNVVPIKFVFIENNQTLWFVDNYFDKTLKNITENPQAALYVYRTHGAACFQVTGDVEVVTSGVLYQRMRERVHGIRSDLPARSLVVMHISKIYNCLPGTEAGKQIG